MREPPQPGYIELTREEPGYFNREVLVRTKSRYDGLVDAVKLEGSGRQFARKRSWTTEQYVWEAIFEAHVMELVSSRFSECSDQVQPVARHTVLFEVPPPPPTDRPPDRPPARPTPSGRDELYQFQHSNPPLAL